MKPVMEYQNFRLYIRDYYAEQKRMSAFTWRDFAKAAGYSSPVFLKLVCDGRANLSSVGVERVASAMGLVGVSLQYFRTLVAFNQEKDSGKKKLHFKALRELAKDNAFAIVGEEQYDYYESWLNPVVRELAPKMPGVSAAGMAAEMTFGASAKEVRKALALLERVGFLEQAADGAYVQSSKALTTGNLEVASMAVRDMHRQMGELAVRALDEVPVRERDISGMTLGLSEVAYQKAVKEIEEFRRRIASIAMEDSAAEKVYRMNVQLFPLTKNAHKGGEDA
ncbi:MAG: TIGR02147 family protein [Fibrobacter sp.]|nr:TIGR02147 family protein [Fibrobacter sp.]